MTDSTARPPRLLQRLLAVRDGEPALVVWAFLYFFALLCGYYILRPVRDAMGLVGGVEHLTWLFTGTFVAMSLTIPLFGWVTSRYPRARFLPIVYGVFLGCLLLFYALFELHAASVWLARLFFIWVSVFNLFVVSVFWSFMADVCSKEQSSRLYGLIAAGGTAGAIVGPALTTWLAKPVGTNTLLLLSAGFLLLALVCIRAILRWQSKNARRSDDHALRTGDAGAVERSAVERSAVDASPPDAIASDRPSGTRATSRVDEPLGGQVWAGLTLVLRSPYLAGIGAFIVLLALLATFLYFEQAEIVRARFASRAERTAAFGAIDLATNVLTLALQFFVTGRLMRRWGVSVALALIPALLVVGFAGLALAPSFAVLVVVQVVRRAGEYAFMRPGREALFVVLEREEKYKAKNVIDTVIYRAGDAAAAWIYKALRDVGLSLVSIAWVAVPLTALWAALAYSLGRAQARRAERGTIGR